MSIPKPTATCCTQMLGPLQLDPAVPEQNKRTQPATHLKHTPHLNRHFKHTKVCRPVVGQSQQDVKDASWVGNCSQRAVSSRAAVMLHSFPL
jgi:hypothetical protein